VLLHADAFAGLVGHVDRVARGDHVHPVHRLVVLAHIVEALGGAGVVVELHAGADAVDEGRALVRQPRLDQRHQLVLVARERATDERRAQLQGHAHQVDSGVVVDHAALGLRALVGGGGELALVRPYTPLFSTI
jgi:hypothetical protein